MYCLVSVPIGAIDRPGDLAAAAFAALATEFQHPGGEPIPFTLRDKRQTQDDPLDEHVASVLKRRLPDEVRVFVSGKPLVSPDLVVARHEEAPFLMEGGSELDSRRIIGIEVKKLNWSRAKAARSTGMDYNSTPPCSSIRIDAVTGSALYIPAFYLYVLLRPQADQFVVDSLALVSGALLNEDTELYNAVTGVRKKSIGIGSYGDGMDRQRPMLVFANPLGWPWLVGHMTLLHPDAGLEEEQTLRLRRSVFRRTPEGELREFFCYRIASEPVDGEERDVTEPFPSPKKRTQETAKRGRFKIKLAVDPKVP